MRPSSGGSRRISKRLLPARACAAISTARPATGTARGGLIAAVRGDRRLTSECTACVWIVASVGDVGFFSGRDRGVVALRQRGCRRAASRVRPSAWRRACPVWRGHRRRARLFSRPTRRPDLSFSAVFASAIGCAFTLSVCRFVCRRAFHPRPSAICGFIRPAALSGVTVSAGAVCGAALAASGRAVSPTGSDGRCVRGGCVGRHRRRRRSRSRQQPEQRPAAARRLRPSRPEQRPSSVVDRLATCRSRRWPSSIRARRLRRWPACSVPSAEAVGIGRGLGFGIRGRIARLRIGVIGRAATEAGRSVLFGLCRLCGSFSARCPEHCSRAWPRTACRLRGPCEEPAPACAL